MFLPQGRLLSLEGFEALLSIPSCVGAKHSSLDRGMEWDRLAVRDRVRPDFLVLTGNDLAIDMVLHGSDYLLGLAAFAPDWFAARDRCWAEATTVLRQNDLLQQSSAASPSAHRSRRTATAPRCSSPPRVDRLRR